MDGKSLWIFENDMIRDSLAVVPSSPGSERLSRMLTRIREANVGRDEFMGDVMIPYNKVKDIIIHELKCAQAQKVING